MLPEVIEEFLDYGTAICCAFNRFGTLLASEWAAERAQASCKSAQCHPKQRKGDALHRVCDAADTLLPCNAMLSCSGYH